MRLTISATSAAASVTGLASNATGATWALSATNCGDAMAHLITVKGDAATDHSAKTAIIVGTDANGRPLTETINLPNGTATVTTTGYFLTVTSVTPSATIGADTMDIGWAAGSISPTVLPDMDADVFSLGFGCTISGSPTYTVQHNYGEGAWFNHSAVAAKTVNADGAYSAPVAGIRLMFAAAGTVTFAGIQAGV